MTFLRTTVCTLALSFLVAGGVSTASAGGAGAATKGPRAAASSSRGPTHVYRPDDPSGPTVTLTQRTWKDGARVSRAISRDARGGYIGTSYTTTKGDASRYLYRDVQGKVAVARGWKSGNRHYRYEESSDGRASVTIKSLEPGTKFRWREVHVVREASGRIGVWSHGYVAVRDPDAAEALDEAYKILASPPTKEAAILKAARR